MSSSWLYSTFFVIAMAVSLLATPLVRSLALRLNAVDRPQSRKVHKEPIPLWGGLAIYLAVLLSVTGVSLFSGVQLTPLVTGILVGGAFIVAIGMIDDAFGMKPLLKLVFQVVGALILLAYQVRIEMISNPFAGGSIFLGNWGALLTVLWVVAVTNAVNLIDGLDGLASGISAIAAGAFFVLSLRFGDLTIALLAAATAGACIGFLRYNFNPATIFMGDAGSMFLGYCLAALSVAGAFKGATAIMLTLPVIVLGLPIFDAFFAVMRRLARRSPIFQADKGHLHHRLLDMGYSQRRAVLFLYAVGAACSLLAIYLSGLR